MRQKTRRRGLRMGDTIIVKYGDCKDTVGRVYSIKRGEGSKLYRISLVGDNMDANIEALLPREAFTSTQEHLPMDYTRDVTIAIHEGEPCPHWMAITHDRIGINLLKGHKVALCHRDFKRMKQYTKFDNWQVVLYPYAKKSYLILSNNPV